LKKVLKGSKSENRAEGSQTLNAEPPNSRATLFGRLERDEKGATEPGYAEGKKSTSKVPLLEALSRHELRYRQRARVEDVQGGVEVYGS
jgi:hypothetical protein